MTKFTSTEWLHEFSGHIVVSLLGTMTDEDRSRAVKGGGGGHDIRVIINGVEVDFVEFAKKVEKQLDSMVAEKAGELLKAKVYDMLEPFHDAVAEFERGLKKQAADMLGYNPWEYER